MSRPNTQDRKKIIPAICPVCGASFMTSKHNIQNHPRSVCSNSCAGSLSGGVRKSNHIGGKNRDKRLAAKRLVWAAIKRGKVKLHPCEICGKSEVHAHHDDYSEPLTIRWLCRKHHAQIHIIPTPSSG